MCGKCIVSPIKFQEPVTYKCYCCMMSFQRTLVDGRVLASYWPQTIARRMLDLHGCSWFSDCPHPWRVVDESGYTCLAVPSRVVRPRQRMPWKCNTHNCCVWYIVKCVVRLMEVARTCNVLVMLLFDVLTPHSSRPHWPRGTVAWIGRILTQTTLWLSIFLTFNRTRGRHRLCTYREEH